jgi:acyl CoA:acetate/3-ketoacid CoA transferase alpha subunit
MQIISVENAVAQITDGARVMIGGFMGVGTPERLIDEMVKQGKRERFGASGQRHRQAGRGRQPLAIDCESYWA